MNPRVVDLIVLGTPAPQGSKRGFVNGRTGRVQMVESSAKVVPWRQAVVSAVLRSATHLTPFDEPVSVEVAFIFLRPRGHYGTGRNAEVLKASAPDRPTSRAHGDIDKLLRSTLDGLADSGLLSRDDLVVRCVAEKSYGRRAGAYIRITPAPPHLTRLVDLILSGFKSAARASDDARDHLDSHQH